MNCTILILQFMIFGISTTQGPESRKRTKKRQARLKANNCKKWTDYGTKEGFIDAVNELAYEEFSHKDINGMTNFFRSKYPELKYSCGYIKSFIHNERSNFNEKVKLDRENGNLAGEIMHTEEMRKNIVDMIIIITKGH